MNLFSKVNLRCCALMKQRIIQVRIHDEIINKTTPDGGMFSSGYNWKMKSSIKYINYYYVCLTSFSTIFYLYSVSQFYWLRKPEYSKVKHQHVCEQPCLCSMVTKRGNQGRIKKKITWSIFSLFYGKHIFIFFACIYIVGMFSLMLAFAIPFTQVGVQKFYIKLA